MARKLHFVRALPLAWYCCWLIYIPSSGLVTGPLSLKKCMQASQYCPFTCTFAKSYQNIGFNFAGTFENSKYVGFSSLWTKLPIFNSEIPSPLKFYLGTLHKTWFYGNFSHIEKHFLFTVLTFSGGNWGPPNPMGNIPIFSSFSWIERPNLLKGTKLIGYHFPLFECFSTPKRFWNAKNYLGNWDQLMGMRRPLSPSPKNSHKIQFLFAVHPLRAFLKSVTFNFVGFYGQTFPLRWFLC